VFQTYNREFNVRWCSRGYQLRGIVAACIFLQFSVPDIARADPACPPWIKETNPIVTRDNRGVALDREYWTNPHGVWFKVPFAYFRSGLGGWLTRRTEPILRMRNPDNPVPKGTNGNATGIAFGFWMPSLRAPSRNWSSFTSFQPCEDGRPKPTAEQFTVEAKIEWPWLKNYKEAGLILPEKRQRNIMSNEKNSSLSFVKFGDNKETVLIRLMQPQENGSLYYFNVPGSSPHFLWFCGSKNTKLPNPSCRGRVWWPEENLAAWVNFSKRNIKDWREILEGVRTLAYRWRDKAKEEIETGVWKNAEQ